MVESKSGPYAAANFRLGPAYLRLWWNQEAYQDQGSLIVPKYSASSGTLLLTTALESCRNFGYSGPRRLSNQVPPVLGMCIWTLTRASSFNWDTLC